MCPVVSSTYSAAVNYSSFIVSSKHFILDEEDNLLSCVELCSDRAAGNSTYHSGKDYMLIPAEGSKGSKRVYTSWKKIQLWAS